MFMPDAIKELQLHKILRGYRREEALCFALEGAYYKRASEEIKDLPFHDCRCYYRHSAVKDRIKSRAAKAAEAVSRGTIKTWEELLKRLDDWIYMDRQAIRKGKLNGN